MPVPNHNTNRHNDDKYSNFALSIALLKARLFVEPAVIGRRRTKQNEPNETDVDAELALLRQLVALRPQAVAHQGVARADRTDPDVSYLPRRLQRASSCATLDERVTRRCQLASGLSQGTSSLLLRVLGGS